MQDKKKHSVTAKIRARPTLNPYLRAADLISRRIAWDLRPQSWVSRSRLRALKDGHAGEKAVILCNGPSLLKTNLTNLKNTFTFGLNKINLLFDRNEFRPSCIVSVNRLVIEQNSDFFCTTSIPLFLDSSALTSGNVPLRQNVTYLHSSYAGFARDCSVSISQGSTVTYVALQLAFHMGFQEVTLVGCDHDFAAKGTPHSRAVSGEEDPDHFDPRYFSGGQDWQLPDLFESEVSYMKARRAFEEADRKLYNSTVGGKLELFERIELSDFLGSRLR